MTLCMGLLPVPLQRAFGRFLQDPFWFEFLW
jgi:hypothetical protein